MLRFDEADEVIRDETGFPAAYVSRIAHERWPDLGKQMALAPELAAALRQCHGAIDILFAELVVATSKGPTLFLPCKSGEPWAAVVAAHELIKRLE
jgi:hypothetical protein